MRKNEKGSILIEFVGSFLLFVLMIASILNLITIVTVQARMHYAITETAKALSMYGYIFHVTGMEKTLTGISSGAADVKNEVNATIDEINDVFGNINSMNLSGIRSSTGVVRERVAGWSDSVGADPKQALQYIMKYAANEIESLAFGELVLIPLVKHYLTNGDQSGEDYLTSVRINDDLQFYSLFSMPGYTPAASGTLIGSITGLADNNSVLLDKDGNVKITVQYEIEYSFFGLRLPWGDTMPKLRVTQSAFTKMWLGGKDYRK